MGQIDRKGSGVELVPGALGAGNTGLALVNVTYTRVLKTRTIANEIFYNLVLELEFQGLISDDSGIITVTYPSGINFATGICVISTNIPDQNNNFFYCSGITSDTILIAYNTHTNGKIFLTGLLQGT
jgi:hypothetical protein